MISLHICLFLQDFANTIPGHGGIMDRFDCQYLMATFVHVYITSFIRYVSVETRTKSSPWPGSFWGCSLVWLPLSVVAYNVKVSGTIALHSRAQAPLFLEHLSSLNVSSLHCDCQQNPIKRPNKKIQLMCLRLCSEYLAVCISHGWALPGRH